MDRRVLAIAGAVIAVLVAFASGYGYHRDELYFLAAGEHLDWAYADQGPLTPLVARAMSEIAPDSLTVLRLPSAIAAGAVVLLTALIARELGGTRRAEVIAAACAAVGAFGLFVGHLLSTSTFDLLAWTAVAWLAIRAVRTGDDRLWLAAGVVLGLGLLNKPLPAFLALGLLAGVAVAGPRRLLRNPYVWAGAGIALLLWAPWIIWQADNGWPQLEVSREIAGGGSTSSEPWWTIVPFQALLASPPLAPVWIAGLVCLFRARAMREMRFLACAWVVLAVVFMVTGGKPYYLAGLLPVLIAAGAVATARWLERGGQARAAALGAAIVASGVTAVVIALPVLPADQTGLVTAMNEDVGETIGWPELTDTVSGVYGGLDGEPVILAQNYGEAGAIDRFGPAQGLPPAYSGHNAYGDWGPPPDGSAPVVAVGLDPEFASTVFDGCEPAAQIDNDAGVENDEQGEAVLVCSGPARPWSEIWPEIERLG